MDRLHLWYGALDPDRSLETSGTMFDCGLGWELETANTIVSTTAMENTALLTI